MKRVRQTVIKAAVVIAFSGVIAALYLFQSLLPIVAVNGRSMEPALASGDLVISRGISIEEVSEGDIIVARVPSLVREAYNYPPRIVHRVVNIREQNGVRVLQTAGDATGKDPFIIRSVDIVGVMTFKVPHAGIVLMFPHTAIGKIITALVLGLLLYSLYGNELRRLRKTISYALYAPIVEQQKRQNTEVREALGEFSQAMREYAANIASHTAAVQGMVDASHDLREAAQELRDALRKTNSSNKKRKRR